MSTSAETPADNPRRDDAARDTDGLAATMLAEAATELDRADQKASLLISGLGIAFSIVLSGLLGGDWTPSTLSVPGLLLWSAGAVLAIAAVIASALAVWPRLSKPPADGTITYWGHVRGMGSPAQVEEALADRGVHDPERRYQQLLVLSSVVQRKYRYIRWSMVLAGGAAVLVPLAFLFAT